MKTFNKNSPRDPVIRQYYRRHPDKVGALVFVDGPLRPLAPNRQVGDPFIAPFRTANYMQASSRFIDTFVVRGQEAAAQREELLARWANTPQHVIVRMLELGILPDAEPSIWAPDCIKVPVLGIYTKGAYIPPDNETFLKTLAPRAEYQVWEDVSHDLGEGAAGSLLSRAARFSH
jgi:pimeloyl-ACP methyl ester carboxylesterase